MKNSTPAWLSEAVGAKKRYILYLVVLQAASGSTGVLFALLVRGVVDSAGAGNTEGFFRYLAGTVLLIAATVAVWALLRLINEQARSSFENCFKKRLFGTLLEKDYATVSAVHSGEWLNRLTNDTVVCASGMTEIIPGLAGMAVRLVSALIMIIALQPVFALVLVPGGILMFVFTWMFRRRMKQMHRQVQEADGRLRITMQERLASLLMVKSFVGEAETLAEAEERMSDHRQARMRRNRWSILANGGFSLAMYAMYLLGIGWCGYGILQGTVTFGTLTAVSQLITQIQTPFASISGYLPRYYAMIASGERLMEAEAFPGSDQKAKEAEEIRAYYDHELASFGLDHVSFTYYPAVEKIAELSKENMPAVVQDLSLEIHKGEYTAFCGHSGCGKSTVLKLLMCVYEPEKGQRWVRNSSGVKQDMDSSWRRMFAYVPQGNALMSGTIRQVVSFADPAGSRDEKRLWAALETACADEFVAALEHGVDTLLGERGTGLSEGQMQRLAVARAIFSGRPVLLLDEATSALDAASEEKLLKNIQNLKDRTVIAITHRPAALAIADRVMEFTESGVKER